MIDDEFLHDRTKEFHVIMNAEHFIMKIIIALSFADMYWTSPELLRDNSHLGATKKGDIYALGIIMCEILTKSPPYHENTKLAPKGTCKLQTTVIFQGSA